MRYKIYKITFADSFERGVVKFIESELNIGCGFGSIEEAYEKIKEEDATYKDYTILPYIYLTNYHDKN